jgi:hypothetical protein
VTVKADLERWTFLPADTLPVGGQAIERLREVEGPWINLADEFIRGGRVARKPPSWVDGRTADAWLISADEELAAPLVWMGDELVATVVVWRYENARTGCERSRLEAAAERRHARRELEAERRAAWAEVRNR